MVAVGSVRELCRYPVKSAVGESLSSVHVESRGVAGDRLWAVRDPDGKLGSGKSTRRFRRMDGLLALTASYGDDGVPVVAFPGGRRLHGSDPQIHRALSEHVGRPVELHPEGEVSHHDEGPLHLVTTASIAEVERLRGRQVDARRFRPNLVVDVAGRGFPEQDWVGTRIAVGGELVLAVRGPMPRCVMVDMAQAGLPADGSLLRLLTDVADMNLGIVADVVTAGTVSLGDPVAVLDR